jgi:hypothetical protein
MSELKTVHISTDDYKTFLGRASKLYFIRDDNGDLINFVPNEGQMMLHDIIEEEFARSMRTKGVPQCRVIILKPRQIGATTYTAIRLLDFLMFHGRCNGLVFAHEDDATERIYSMRYRTPFDELPDHIVMTDKNGQPILDSTKTPIKIKFKPETKADSGYHIQFKDQTQSDLWVRSAGGKLVKGGSINLLHFTEAADMTKYEALFRAVENELSLTALNFAVVESTANGVSGDGEGFYKDWVNSVKEWDRFIKGETDTFNGYRPVFLPWYKFSKHRVPLTNGKLIDIDHLFSSQEQRNRFYDREQILTAQKQVPIEAINWYRYHLKEKLRGDFDAMNQYFPTVPEDAFLASDKCFFDSIKLFDIKSQYETKEPEYERGSLDSDLNFTPSPIGDLKIWQQPDDTYMYRYVVSCDSSKGLEEGDYTCMWVFDRLKQKYVARWHGKIAEDLAAQELLNLAYYYNDALIIVEENLATIANLIKPEGLLAYSGPLYFRDIRAGGELVWHWQTSSTSRKILLDSYRAGLRENYEILPDLESVDEHMSFVRKTTGRGNVKYEADTGKKDDIVMSGAMAYYAAQWWEEPIAELNARRNDIQSIINVRHKQAKPVKHTGFGMPKTEVYNVKRK